MTKGLTSTFKHNVGGNPDGGGDATSDQELQKLKTAISYLMLTQEKLENFSGYSNKINNFLCVFLLHDTNLKQK